MLILLAAFVIFAFCRRDKILIGVLPELCGNGICLRLKMFRSINACGFCLSADHDDSGGGDKCSGEGKGGAGPWKNGGHRRDFAGLRAVERRYPLLLERGKCVLAGLRGKEGVRVSESVTEPDERVHVSSQAPIFDHYNGYDFTELADTGCQVMVGWIR